MSDTEKDTEAPEAEDVEATPAGTVDPAEFAAVKLRAEGAERKLREIQQTFTAAKAELDATRVRLERDLARKVELKFADLLSDLLDCAEDLDRALEYGRSIKAAAPVVKGVALARERFLAALFRAGLERIEPTGETFDPNLSEAAGVVPVQDPAAHDTVVGIERAGYKLGGRVIRPARVLVGRLLS